MPDEPIAGDAGTGGATAEPGQEPHAPDPTGQEPHAPDPTGQDPYGQGPYTQRPYGQDAHTQGPYTQSPPGPAPYGQGPWGQGPYAQGPPGSPSPYGQAPYGQAPYGQAPYGGYGGYGPPPGGYGQGPYGGYVPPGGAGHFAGHGPQFSGQGYNWPYVPPRPRRTPEERRKRKRKLAGFLGIFVVFLGVGILIGALIAPANPRTVAEGLVSKAITAAAQAGAYHYVDLATIGGIPDNITGDAGPNSGRQVITQRCATGTNVFDLRLVRGVVYFRGNAPAVVDQLGVAKARARAEVDKWVRVVKGETPYHSFAEGITAKSNISQLKTTIVVTRTTTDTRTSPPTTKILGALRVNKTQYAGSAALVIATATSLPRSLSGDAQLTAGRYTLSWTFSHFHEALQVTAPAHPVAFASLHATTPPKSVCG